MTYVNPALQKVVDRIKALRNLANGNMSEGEMKAALHVANMEMQKHRITESMLEEQKTSIPEPHMKLDVEKAGRRTEWRETLLGAITQNYGCAWYLYSHRKPATDSFSRTEGSEGETIYTIVGRISDVEIVEYFYVYLTAEVVRISKVENKGKGRGYAKSWLSGCARGLATQFENDMREIRQLAANNNQERGMALLDNRREEARAYMKTELKITGTVGAVSGGNRSNDGYSSGYATGKSMNIRRGMGGGNSSGRLGQ